MNEMGVSARAKRRRFSQPMVTCCYRFEEFYIYSYIHPLAGQKKARTPLKFQLGFKAAQLRREGSYKLGLRIIVGKKLQI